MKYEALVLEHKNNHCLLTLNRPEKRNALTHEMVAELHSALDEVENSPARVLIVTGAGTSFCAGMDLAVLKEMSGEPGIASDDQMRAGSRRIAGIFRHFYDFPKPAIAAVNGHAVAGGCGIAALCDFTLAVPEAKFGYTEVRIGFMPAFVLVFLIRQIGEKRARDLALTGRILGAEEARELGLVNEVLPPERLMARAREIADLLIAASPTSLRFTKRLMRDLFQEELDRELDLAVESSAHIRSTYDFHEGLSAFLEKRKPRWQDR